MLTQRCRPDHISKQRSDRLTNPRDHASKGASGEPEFPGPLVGHDPRPKAGSSFRLTHNLRVGGEFQVRHADGERRGHVDACEPLQHLRVRLRDADPRPGQPEEILIDASLTADGGQTILVVEVRGLPLHLLAAYGTGVQIHVEHLADHISGRESSDTEARWEKLLPSYEDLAAEVS